MSFQDCINEITAAAGRELSDEEIEKISNRLQRAITKRKNNLHAESLDSEFRAIAADEARQAQTNARIARRNVALNIRARQRIDEFLKKFPDKAEGLKAMLVGVVRGGTEGRRSIDARGLAIERGWLGGMVHDLRTGNLMDIVTSGEMDLDIAKEMWAIRRNAGPNDPVPGNTGNREAQQIADIFHKYKEAARRRQNRAGAFIGDLDGHINQAHNWERVQRMGKTGWMAHIDPMLDADRTFGDISPAERATMLENIYDDIINGEHIGGVVRSGEAANPANLAKSISKPRVLHFKDAETWWKYNERLGMGNLVEGTVYGMARAARNSALMETLGPNPRLMFDAVLATVKNETRDSPKIVRTLKEHNLENQFKEVSGESLIPQSNLLAKWSRGLRAWQTWSKLGGATLSSISDVNMVATNANYRGDSFLGGYGTALQSALLGRRGDALRAIAEDLGVGFEGIIGYVAARFSAQDDIPGTASKLTNLYFRLNLLSWWTDAMKTGAALAASSSLARNSANNFLSLDGQLRNVLVQHGISEPEWNVVRQATRDAEGTSFITPETVMELPLESFDAIIAQRVASLETRNLATPKRVKLLQEQAREEVATRLREMFTDEANFAVPTPGAAERSIINQGLRPGTPVGEALRNLWQFKSFPLTVSTKVIGRAWRGSETGGVDAGGLAPTMLGLIAAGYLAMSAKDLVSGRTPRDPTEILTWTSAISQGGGMGLYGDFLLGEHNRYGQSFWESISGPSFGMISDAHDVFSSTVRDGGGQGDEALRLAVQNTPFANLFYTREALNYLLVYQLQESMNPGYLRRMERRTKETNSSDYWLAPSQTVARGGGFK